MTIKLYDTNPYETSFHAEVISCNKLNNEYDVVLDQTLFFPTSGGQLCDTGTLNDIEVLHVEIENDTIHHYLNTELQGSVEGHINFKHRYDLMQNHSGEHIFSGIVHSMYGYDNVGFHLGKDEMTVDFNGYLSNNQLDEIELKVNETILKNIPIKCFYVEDENQYTYRSKKEIEGALRLCVIEDIDICACCAPHVKSTIEVGLFKVLKSMKYKEGVRVFLACGSRAYQDYRFKHQEVSIISQNLSLPPYDVHTGVEKLLSQINELKQAYSSSRKELLNMKVNTITSCNEYIEYVKDIDTNSLRDYALMLFDKVNEYVFIYTGENNNYQFILLDHNDVQSRFNVLKTSLNIHGGGKPPMIQGKITDSIENMMRVLKKNG